MIIAYFKCNLVVKLCTLIFANYFRVKLAPAYERLRLIVFLRIRKVYIVGLYLYLLFFQCLGGVLEYQSVAVVDQLTVVGLTQIRGYL